VRWFVGRLYENKKVAAAAHNIVAYRVCPGGNPAVT
jgi:hypothetical protein